jgi:hypothetical protein
VRQSQGNYLQNWITRTSFESPTIAPGSWYNGGGEGVSLVVSSRTNGDDASENNVVFGANVASRTDVASGINVASGTNVTSETNVATGSNIVSGAI